VRAKTYWLVQISVAFGLSVRCLQIRVALAGEIACALKQRIRSSAHQNGGQFLCCATAKKVTLTLNGLTTQGRLTVQFLFAAIDSLDGTGTFTASDFCRIDIDIDGVNWFLDGRRRPAIARRRAVGHGQPRREGVQRQRAAHPWAVNLCADAQRAERLGLAGALAQGLLKPG
jgi:hypothetical protein